MLRVSLLGDFGLWHDEAPVTEVDSPRLRGLLAYLLLHREAPQPRGHLAFLFWPDTTEAQARTNLRNLLHQLRHVLPDADAYVESDAQTLQWRPGAPLALDVADFNAALAAADQAQARRDPAQARAALERAAALYKGDLLPSCYDDWIMPLREELRQAYLGALERLILMLEEQRDYGTAIGYARRLLRHDPLHEATYRHLMRLHALDGDRAGAVRAYHTCTTVLQHELGVEPSAVTQEAYQQLLAARPGPVAAESLPTVATPLVGREREWARMLQAWRRLMAGGQPHVVILCGEAGIGKTRLAEELLQWALRQGITGAHARCYAAEGQLAYAPVTAWLRANPVPPLQDIWLAEVARLLPEALAQRPDLPLPGPLTEAWQRERLFEALVRAILGLKQPLLLAIDDLQWCDRDTVEWLHFLLRFDRSARLLVVGAYRPEEIGDGHPLHPLLRALRLEGQVTEIDLEPLDEAATRTLAARVAGREIDADTAGRLYQETEGVPLFVVETVRAGLPVCSQKLNAPAAPVAPGDAPAGEPGLPPKVRSVLQARLAQLSPSSRELAGLAATIGREFGFSLLAKASGRDENLLVGELDELWRRRIVREHGADAYDFSHDKLREVAYGELSAARRRLLHQHVGQALEALHAAELDAVYPQLAAHYERAGLPARAVPCYLAAAAVARRVYANDEAVALLRRGLALAEAGSPCLDPAGSIVGEDVVARLWEELGGVLALMARHEEALQAYAEAQARAPEGDQVRRARLHLEVGAVMREQRRYAEALAACQRAEAALGTAPGEDPDPWWAQWLDVQVERVWAHYWLAQWPEMEALVDKVQPVVQARARVASRQRFLLASCMVHLRKKRYVVSDEMLADSREALAASQELGSLKPRIESQFELGFLHLWRRELDEADQNLRAALALAERSGFALWRTLALTYLTVACRFRGEVDAVTDYALRAREAAEAAHMPDYVAAAKANQAWLAWRNRDLAVAEQRSREALAQWRQSPLVYPFQWQALWPLLAVALARGCADDAWTHIRALLEPSQQHLPEPLNTALEYAIQALAGGQASEARAHLDQAVALARKWGYL